MSSDASSSVALSALLALLARSHNDEEACVSVDRMWVSEGQCNTQVTHPLHFGYLHHGYFSPDTDDYKPQATD